MISYEPTVLTCSHCDYVIMSTVDHRGV